jgi:hypothetical protein
MGATSDSRVAIAEATSTTSVPVPMARRAHEHPPKGCYFGKSSGQTRNRTLGIAEIVLKPRRAARRKRPETNARVDVSLLFRSRCVRCLVRRPTAISTTVAPTDPSGALGSARPVGAPGTARIASARRGSPLGGSP